MTTYARPTTRRRKVSSHVGAAVAGAALTASAVGAVNGCEPPGPAPYGRGDSQYAIHRATLEDTIDSDLEVDGTVGYGIAQATPRLEERLADRDAPWIVTDLGGNDVLLEHPETDYRPAIRHFLEVAGDRPVYWTNLAHNGAAWVRFDEVLDEVAVTHPTLHVLDYASWIAGHEGQYLADLVHLNAVGAAAYARWLDGLLPDEAQP